jgi:acyl-CoA thioester hydrolase
MLLDAGALAARGLTGQLGWSDAVRFGELDPLGHVNNVAHLAWFEALRVRYLTARGLTSYGPDDPGFVVRRQDAEYRAEMRLHDEYVVTAATTRLGRTSFEQSYEVHAGGGLAASGTCTLVAVRDGRPLPLTDGMRAALAD